MFKHSSLFALAVIAAGFAAAQNASAQGFGQALQFRAPVYSTKVCYIPARPPETKTSHTCAMPSTMPLGVVCYCAGVDKQDGVVKAGKPVLSAR